MSFDFKAVTKIKGADSGEWIKCPLTPKSNFEVCIAFLDNDAMEALMKDCQRKVKDFDRVRGETVTERLDPEKFARRFAESVIRDWRGLDREAMAELFPGMDDEQLAQIPDGGIIPDNDAKYQIIDVHADMFTWVKQISTQRAAFARARKERELGNSGR